MLIIILIFGMSILIQLTMATFLLQPNNAIYLYHWFEPTIPFKVSTKLMIDPIKWDKNKGRAKSSKLAYKGTVINQELHRYEAALYKTIDYFKVNRGFTKVKFRSKFNEYISRQSLTTKKFKQSRFLDFFKDKVDEFKENKDTRSKGYGTTLNYLIGFFGNKKPSFADIDTKFYSNFNKYLFNLDLSTNTISNQWKHIKALMKNAETQMLHSSTDYKSFRRSSEDSDSIYLTELELDSIHGLKLTGVKAIVRDYFLIGCYTGLRYSDWDKLTNSKIKDGLATIRSAKTGELSIIPIHPRVNAILKSYRDGIVPKKLSSQTMNEYIKAIGLQAKINDDIETRITKGGIIVKTTTPKYKLMTSHTGRRTFASLLVLRGVSPYVIMKITGHKTLTSFESYIRFKDLQASIELKNIDFFK